MRRQQHKVFPAPNLHVDIFVVVFVQSGRRQGIADPEVDGFRFGFLVGTGQGDAGPVDGGRDVAVEGEVFLSEIVVFFEGVLV